MGIHVTWQFFEARDPQGHFSEKNLVCLWECVYQISGLNRLLIDHWFTDKPTNKKTDIRVNIGVPTTYACHVDSITVYLIFNWKVARLILMFPSFQDWPICSNSSYFVTLTLKILKPWLYFAGGLSFWKWN